MQLILEIATLFLVFFFFRQAITKAFPVQALGMPLSEDSKSALHRYRKRYLMLFWASGILWSALLLLLLRQIFLFLHHLKEAPFILTVEWSALLLPSCVLGFLAGTFIARWLNMKMQQDGLSFFFDEYRDEMRGFNSTKIRGWHIAIAVIMAGVMIYLQYNVYAASDGKVLQWQTQPGAEIKTPVSQITRIVPMAGDDFMIILDSGDSLSTEKLTGPKKNFIQSLRKRPR